MLVPQLRQLRTNASVALPGEDNLLPRGCIYKAPTLSRAPHDIVALALGYEHPDGR